MAAARLQRWAILLSAYSLTIEYCNTRLHGNPDALSRLPTTAAESVPEERPVYVATMFNSNSRSFQPGAVFSHFTFQADFHFGISFYYQNTITG